MAAWGQTKAHLLHWMQTAGSQTGMSVAIERFSHWAVAVGHVPSMGKAETGSRSPLPSRITEVTLRTNSGALSETAGGRFQAELTVRPLVSTSCRCSRVASTAAKLR